MDLSKLNNQQKEAVLNSYNSNTVLIAGAGSGKTSTLQNRVGYLIDDMGVDPSAIMVVTFTNKAANEIKGRLALISPDVNKMWLGTFHSICVKILIRYGKAINIKNFSIMDKYDAKALIKEVMMDRNLPIDNIFVNQYSSRISDCKSKGFRPQDIINKSGNSSDLQFAHVYQDYQNLAWKRKSFDFDDLIIYAIVLLSASKQVRDHFHDTVKYIMVDEAQDTNTAQFQLIRILTGESNLLLVGDDDQSIYSFRNAKPEYLLNFQRAYPNAKTMRLEQNYRSTQTIIRAANAVVKNNTVRNDKTMFCNNRKGDPIVYHNCRSAYDEADWVATEIKLINSQNVDYKDVAILYRVNSQSRAIEEAFMKISVPFRVVGSLGFYDRKEIKDLLAYCKLKANPDDELSYRRVLNIQKGVGKKSVDNIIDHANDLKKDKELNYIECLAQYSAPKRIQNVLVRLYKLLSTTEERPVEFIDMVLTGTGYKRELVEEGTPESQTRVENIDEFLSIAQEHEKSNGGITLKDFVNEVSLSSNPEERADQDAVTLMTIHSAKGLEFSYVFMVGVEEELLPHRNSFNTSSMIEEERRLMYVGMTRAKLQLYILNAKERRDFKGNTICNEPSRFIDEIPEDCMLEV